jgi:hypothetical protein
VPSVKRLRLASSKANNKKAGITDLKNNFFYYYYCIIKRLIVVVGS